MGQKMETIENLIYRSTDEYLTQENWAYIMDVCDFLNHGGDIKSVIFVLQKRFSYKNTNIQLYSLSLVEALVKNCGPDLHREIGSQEFIETLLKLFKDSHTHSMVKERILSLIQQWAVDFVSDPFFRVIRQTYDQLKSEYKYIKKEVKDDMDELREKEEKELQLALALSLEKAVECKSPQKNIKYNEEHFTRPKQSSFPTPIFKVKALYDFQAAEPGELSFRKGNIITVLETTYKDWWRGSLDTMVGIFPANYVEKLLEPTPDELRKEMEDEIKVLSFEENIEKLLEILSNVDSIENNNIIENDQFQNLYHLTLTIRSKLVKLIKKYAQKKDDIISLNERFTRAIKDYEILMEKSMTHFSHTSSYNSSIKEYNTPVYDNFQKHSYQSNIVNENENINNSTELYYLSALHDQHMQNTSFENTKRPS
ncbi:unnamed protein product [Pneumocystis jirovecii]|uniref:Class E vacuolar protein-sorting machinery protein HSE1 n=1 Tax=Pneumocystis jirovecii TaxID=42068 RepID=L0PE36_PNEJI|nr:unnamed protein product [Pneumocystis jirovecii]